MGRHELTDEQWDCIKEHLPTNGKRGKQWQDHRRILNGMLWRLITGSPWRDVPPCYGSWQTIYDRFNRWSADGTLLGIMRILRANLDDQGGVDWSLWCIDSSIVRAHQSAGGASAASQKKPQEPDDHALGRSQGGLGTKMHIIVDGEGLPLDVELTPGQQHESTRCEPLIVRMLEEPDAMAPQKLAGDKGYSVSKIRRFLEELGIEDVIARRENEKRSGAFDKDTYRRRNVVERCIGWLKQCRAVATRYDKLATNFLGTLHLAIIQLLLKRLA